MLNLIHQSDSFKHVLESLLTKNTQHSIKQSIIIKLLKILSFRCLRSALSLQDNQQYANCQKYFLQIREQMDLLYNQQSSLILIHMKEFKCQVCSKTFRYLSLYQRHVRIHSQEKSFKCETCGKAFNRPDTLKTHMNIHSQTGFACCGRFFHSKAALKYHQRTAHIVKVHKCKECPDTFQNQKDLDAHIQTHNVTEFPMLLDCIATQESNSNEENQEKLIFVVDEGAKKHSIWSEASLLLSYLRVVV